MYFDIKIVKEKHLFVQTFSFFQSPHANGKDKFNGN